MEPKYELPHVPGVCGHAYNHWHSVGYSTPIGGTHTSLAACCVCQVNNRSTVIMIPAKANCPATWNREYNGYLMTEYFGTGNARYMYECIDTQKGTIVGYQNGQHAMLLNHVEAVCDKDLTCATWNQFQVNKLCCLHKVKMSLHMILNIFMS